MIGVDFIKRGCFGFGFVILASIAMAQKGDTFDQHVADYRLLMSKKVQKEVGVTEAQRKRLNDAADHERKVAEPYLMQFQQQRKDPSTLNTDQTYLGFLMDLRNNVLAVLTPGQVKRLGELSLQSVDVGGVLDVVVAKKIGMSVAQLTKARAVYADGVKKSAAVFDQIKRQVAVPYKNMRVKTQAEAKALNERIMKDRNDALKKKKPELDGLAKETKRKVEAVLTTKQLAAYHALQGKPFNPN